MPKFGGVGGDPAVALAEGLGGDGGTEYAGVGDLGDRTKAVQSQRKIAGGTVVTFAECGGDDQDAGGHFFWLGGF